jgi:hypothetical protein
VSARPIPIIGLIRGAINIAPITTAVESVRTPIAEMIEANTISRTNPASLRGAPTPS